MQRERLLWAAIAVFLAILAVYRQFDLADLITGLGRDMAVDDRWYDRRRAFQEVGLGAVAMVVLLAAAITISLVHAVNGLALTALAACAALLMLLGTNAVSLHATDALLRSGYLKVNVYNVVEAGSLTTILAASLIYRRQVTVVLRR